ncbi:cation:proton antiporter domain-containing protein [Nocardiopsis coralliicola]
MQRHRRRILTAALLLLPIVVLALVAERVTGLESAAAAAGADDYEGDALGRFFLSAAVVLACCFGAGRIADAIGQPRVLGEIAAGIVLGPSLLGAVAPGVSAVLFPESVLPLMTGVAQVGLVLFMFGVGRELGGMRLRGAVGRSLAISQASLMIPLAAGAATALLLVDRYMPAGVHPGVFVFYIGCALSITAFPVLARIISETGLSGSLPGRLSLFAAAVGDCGSWILLGIIIAVAQGTGVLGVLGTTAAAAAIIAVVLGPLRARLERYAGDGAPAPAGGRGTTATLAILAICVLGAAALTSALGVHQLIGALVVGVAWPRRHPVARKAAEAASGACTFLLPFFFVGFGFSVDLTGLGFRDGSLAVLALLVAVAAATKIVGAGLCARFTGVSWRDAATIGVLLNSRGLTELVVLQVGYDTGIIDGRLLAVLTAGALITTFATGPLLTVVRPHRGSGREAGGSASEDGADEAVPPSPDGPPPEVGVAVVQRPNRDPGG